MTATLLRVSPLASRSGHVKDSERHLRHSQRKLAQARHDLDRIRAHNKVLMLQAREYAHLFRSPMARIFGYDDLPVFPAEARVAGSRDPFGFQEMAAGGVTHGQS